jgi:hypothetical protein
MIFEYNIDMHDHIEAKPIGRSRKSALAYDPKLKTRLDVVVTNSLFNKPVITPVTVSSEESEEINKFHERITKRGIPADVVVKHIDITSD